MARIEGWPDEDAGEQKRGEADEKLPPVDDVKGLSGKAGGVDDVDGHAGRMMPASKARKL